MHQDKKLPQNTAYYVNGNPEHHQGASYARLGQSKFLHAVQLEYRYDKLPQKKELSFFFIQGTSFLIYLFFVFRREFLLLAM